LFFDGFTERAHGNAPCFWSLTEPEIVHKFEGSEAWFEAEGEVPDIRILRRGDNP